MKNLRISLISLVLGLALGSTTAWAAESVMSLISTGEALQKEVLDDKAKAESTDKANRDLAAEGKELTAANNQLNADITSMTNDANSVKQRTADYQNRCGPDKKLNQDEFKACTADKDQINADIAKSNSEHDSLKKRQDDLLARISKYNDAIKTNPTQQKQAYSDYNASLKKEAVWLDQARSLMTSDAFKAYGAKAGCPDVNKPTKTTDAMLKMTDDVLTCLKKVSAGN